MDKSAPPPFKRILLATEGTEFDAGAERVAIALAASCGVPLRAVMPLVSNAEYATMAAESENRAEAEAAGKIAALGETAAAAGVAFAGNVRLGEEPYKEIIEEAREQQSDLLVLRRRGKRSFLANLLLGEMVHTVVGNAPCDVLIVPRAAGLWHKAIVLATDGSGHSGRATAVAAAIAAHHGLPLTVVSAVDARADTRSDSAKADGAAAAAACVASALAAARAAGAEAASFPASEGKPYEVILDAAQKVSADLIVVGRRGLGPIKRMLLGSNSERVAGAANSPVLIVHNAAAAGE